jgi:hypothetical protein
LKEISEMIFLQDHLRIRSATYAIVPFIDLEGTDKYSATLEDLAHLQAVIAYFYASPHPIFCDPFFKYEHASLAIFSPGQVPIFMARPDYHVEWVGPENSLKQDDRGDVPGYRGLYNFKHHFFATSGSRLYPPFPNVALNMSQDMAADLNQFMYESSHYPLLMALFEKPRTDTSERVLRAIDWFNSGNSVTANEEESLASLAVAMEALLGLPDGDRKTERFVDSVSLLLGRSPRLDAWVL